MVRDLGGATGSTITELRASSRTSSGLLGLNSSGVSKSTLPESTLESLLTFDTAPPVAILRRVGVGVSMPVSRQASFSSSASSNSELAAC